VRISWKGFFAIALLALLIAITGATAELTSLPKIHVYSDGSVAVELTYTKGSVSAPGLKEVLALGSLNVGDNYYEAMVNASAKTSAEPGPYRMHVELSANVSGEGYKSTARLELRVWDERDNELRAVVDPLTSEVNATQLTVGFRGTASVRAVGEAKQVLTMFSMLNKPMIEMYLAQANVTWVRVKSLTTTISDDQARIDFDVEIDYAKMAEVYKANTTLIRELFKPSLPTTLSAHLYFDSISLKFSMILKSEENVNAALERLASSLKTLLELSRAQVGPTIIANEESVARGPLITPIAPVMPPEFEPYLNLLDYFSKNFEIVKSKSTVNIELNDGILRINLLTPKVVKKGAKSPTETLLALYDFASKVQEELKLEKLLNTTVELAPEAGLKVLREGVEVKQARLGDLKDLKALIMTSLSISVEPSKVNVGDSITVRGSITPAMATTITLIVREPDGTVKRLETTSSLAGLFGFTVKLEKEGKYSFMASFPGDAERMASTSPEVYVEAAPVPTLPWLYVVVAVMIIIIVVAGIATARVRKAKKASSAPSKT
jgi:hypothetical protein